MDQQNLASEIWAVADLLRGDFKQSEFGKIILPFTVLRRLECVLEPTSEAVLKQNEAVKDDDLDPDLILLGVAGAPFYNTSEFTLASLGPTSTRHNLEEYITFQPMPARSSTSSPSATGSSGSTSTICSISWSRSSVASSCTRTRCPTTRWG